MSQAGILNIGNVPPPPGSVVTLTGNSGGSVGPNGSGNINIVGTGTTQVIDNPGTNTLTITPTAGGYPITPYVVGPVGQAGYQTIQTALNAANAAGGGIVWVQPGTYTENLTLFNNTQVIGNTVISDFAGVTIVGVHTPPTTGNFNFGNVSLQSATDIFSSNVAGSATLVINNSAITLTSGFIFNLPNWTGGFVTYDVADFSTNNGVVNNTGGAGCFFISATHGAGTAKTMVTSGSVVMQEIDFNCPWNAATGTTIACDYVIFTQSTTVSNNSTGNFSNCRFTTSANTPVTMNSSAVLSITDCIINSTANPVINGSGTGILTLGGITFVQGKNIAVGLTLVGATGFYPTLGTDGQVFLAKTKGAGTFASLTSSDSSVTFVTGPNSLDLTVSAGTGVIKTITGNTGGAESPLAGNFNVVGTGSITVAGTANTETVQLTGMTNHAVLVGDGTATLTKLAVGSNGQVLIGSTGADPAFATITSAGGTIAFTLGANTLNMEVANGGFTWVDATGATQALAVQTGYVTDRGGGVTYTLPASAVLGNEIVIVGKLGLATITPNANQQILIGSASGTVGVTGTAVSNNVGDCITLVCITAGASTVYRANSVVGTWTLN